MRNLVRLIMVEQETDFFHAIQRPLSLEKSRICQFFCAASRRSFSDGLTIYAASAQSINGASLAWSEYTEIWQSSRFSPCASNHVLTIFNFSGP